MTSDQRYRALAIAIRARDQYVLAEWEAVLSREDLKDERFEGLQQEVRLLADLTCERTRLKKRSAHSLRDMRRSRRIALSAGL